VNLSLQYAYATSRGCKYWTIPNRGEIYGNSFRIERSQAEAVGNKGEKQHSQYKMDNKIMRMQGDI
jgi:hypothetical protein